MAGETQDIIREFLVESHENLARLDQEVLELEQRPHEAALLASVFRTFHTIKGTCGFLGFPRLEGVAHQAESLLSQIRDGKRDITPAVISLILETIDGIRRILSAIEAGAGEGSETYENLTARLRNEVQGSSVNATAAATGTEEVMRPSAVADANIRVAVGLLDKLMDLVGELVLTRNQILQFNAEREDAALNATSQRLNLITTELQEGVMKTRMQPIGMVWNKLPRVVHDMAAALGKQIRLEMDGSETELDRTIIEAIRDPLVHLVRNACDHGIEASDQREQAGKPPHGTLTLRAYHEGGQVNIEISDDGAGIDVARVQKKALEKGLLRSDQAEKLNDREALNLIFEPGFSTAEAITKISGRGVGLDVVKSHVEKIGGAVDLFSRPGEGTTVKLKIPLTLAIIPGLVIASGGERFVIPQVSLLELIRIEGETRIEHVHGTRVYRRRGTLLPLAYLNEVLALDSNHSEAVSIVVLQAEDRQFGLVVDGINDTQEIVVKPLGKQLKGLTVYAGATIMGDGRVALILDVLGIGQRSGVLAESREQGRTATEQNAASEAARQRLLLFRSGPYERLAVPLSLVARLEEFPRESIERAGGRHVVQYRDRILPLAPLKELLDSGRLDTEEWPELAQVIVFTHGEHSLGVVVDQILDIAEETVAVRQSTTAKGLLGSAVVGKKVADFLDVDYVIRTAAEDWLHGAATAGPHRKVLVADASPFNRGLIRSELEMAGYRVLEAACVEQALRAMEQEPADVVVSAVDLPSADGMPLITALRARTEWQKIPVLGLAESPDQLAGISSQESLYQECQTRLDREAMMQSIERLAAAVRTETAPAVVTERR